MIEVLIRRIDPDVELPSYAHPGDAGADVTTTVDITLQPGERAVVPTGLSIALPDGYVALSTHGRVWPRSPVSRSSTPRVLSMRATGARSRCC